MLASIGRFAAFTIQNAAYVRALGQIELVFTFAASVFFFRERTNRVEVPGISLVVAGNPHPHPRALTAPVSGGP